MRIPLMVVCDHAHNHDGVLTCVGIRRRLFIPEVPWWHPQIFLAWEMVFDSSEFLENEPSALELRVTLQNQDGRAVVDLRRNSVVRGQLAAGQKGSHYEVLGLSNVEFKNFGTHTFVIRVNGEVKQDVTFDVLQQAAPARPPNGDG